MGCTCSGFDDDAVPTGYTPPGTAFRVPRERRDAVPVLNIDSVDAHDVQPRLHHRRRALRTDSSADYAMPSANSATTPMPSVDASNATAMVSDERGSSVSEAPVAPTPPCVDSDGFGTISESGVDDRAMTAAELRALDEYDAAVRDHPRSDAHSASALPRLLAANAEAAARGREPEPAVTEPSVEALEARRRALVKRAHSNGITGSVHQFVPPPQRPNALRGSLRRVRQWYKAGASTRSEAATEQQGHTVELTASGMSNEDGLPTASVELSFNALESEADGHQALPTGSTRPLTEANVFLCTVAGAAPPTPTASAVPAVRPFR